MPDVDLSKFNAGLLQESWYAELEDYIIALDVCPNASQIAVITVEGNVYLITDHGNSAQYKLLGQHTHGANDVSWCCDGTEFATAGHDGLVKIWNAKTEQHISELDAGDTWVSKVVYSPYRRILATAAGKQLKLWNEQRDVIYASDDHASTVADIGWNPDDSAVAAVAYNGLTLHVPGKQKKPRKYLWKGSSLALAWSPDGKYIATGEQDSTVHFWRIKSGKDAQMCGFPTKVLELAWDSKGEWLATGGGKSICLWDCRDDGPEGTKPQQLAMHPNKVTQLCFQPNGTLLASTDAEFIFLWAPKQHGNMVGGASLSSPASCLAWCSSDKLIVAQHDGKVTAFRLQKT